MKISKDSIALLYRTNKINADGVKKALDRGWIEKDEYLEILESKKVKGGNN